MKNKKLVFVLAATMLLAACGPKPGESSSGTDKPTSSVKSDGATSSNHKHSYGEWTTTKEPTCTEKGQKERTCECGEKQTQDIATVDHTYGDWKETKAPTCDADGEKERECSVCHTKETAAVPTTGHNWGPETTVEGSGEKVGYRTAKCSVDNSIEIAIAGKSGKLASGSSLKSDNAYPDSMKLGSNGHSISYTFDFNRTGTGKVYFYGAMDYWSDNSERGFYSGKNNNNETPNFTLNMNGQDVDISSKKDIPYSSMYKNGESAEHSGYTNNELIEVGEISVTAGTNVLTFTRNESYNILVQDFIIVLEQYGDEVDITPEPDSWLKLEADNGIDTEWSDIYVQKASGNFYFVEQDDLYDAKWLFEEGDKLIFNEIVTKSGYSVASVKVNGVEATATEVPDGRGTKTIYEATLTAAGEQKVEIASVKDPDTFYTFTADAHVTAWVASFSGGDVDEYAVFNYSNPMTGEPMANKDSVEFVYADNISFMLSAIVEDGYEIDYIKVDGQSADVGDGGDGVFGIYAEVTSDGSHTVEIKTKEMPKPDSSLVLDFDEHVSEDTYICLDHFNFFSQGIGYSAQWFYEEGEIMYIDPVFEDGYVLDEITVDGVKVTSEYDEENEGYPVTLTAAGQHTVKITSKEDTDSTVSITADEHVAMFIGTIDNDDGDYGIMLDNENASKEFKYADDQTWMIQAVAAEGYLIDTIKVNGEAVDFVSEDTGEYIVSCAMGMLESEGVYEIEITTKQAPNAKLSITADDNVIAFQCEITGADDETLGLINWGTGEGEVAVEAKFIAGDNCRFEGMVYLAAGYTIDTISIDGECFGAERLEDDGSNQVFKFYRSIGEGEHVIEIKTKQAKPFTESESGNGEVEEW